MILDMTGLEVHLIAQVSNLVDILRNSTDRLLSRFCRDESLMKRSFKSFYGKRSWWFLVDSQLFMEEKEIKVAKSYLEEFFATMENDKQFEYQIFLMKCRR